MLNLYGLLEEDKKNLDFGFRILDFRFSELKKQITNEITYISMFNKFQISNFK